MNLYGQTKVNAPTSAPTSTNAMYHRTPRRETEPYGGHWPEPNENTQSNRMPQQAAHKKDKKTGAMRWLNPDWSIVRWVKHVIYDEDDDE